MLPEGWKIGKVSTVIKDLESGVSVNGEDRTFDKDEKAVLKVSAVTYGKFNPNAAKVINLQELERAKTNPKKGQVIISRSNTEALVGASAFIDKDYPNLFLPDKLWQTVPQSNSCMKWLSYLLASARTRYTLSNLATGTSGSMKNITKSALLDLAVLIPPFNEQKKIAQILSTWDKAITTTEQLLSNSQQQKKALMQQLLTGKKRLLDDNGVRFSGEWKKLKLKKLFDFKRGKGLSKSAIKKDGQKKCILYGELFTCYPEVISNVLSRTNEGNSILSVKGDILIPSSTTTSGVDLANATALLESGVLLGGDINILRPKEKLSSRFFAYLLTHIEKYQIASFAQGITIIHIYGADLKKVEVKVPLSISEQQKIAAVLTSADQEIDSLQQKIEVLKKEKKALMQQLLTGKRRVKLN